MPNIRPPIKIHGGKFYMASRIIELFPPHKTYVEPYGGAASVLLNKPQVGPEIYNDLDGRLTRLFRVLRDNYEEFSKLLALTPYSELEFDEAESNNSREAAASNNSRSELEQTRRDFVRWRQSLGGRGRGFSYSVHRSRRGMADVVSGWLSAIDDQLPLIVERFRQVQIMNRPALEVIQKWDSPDTLFYLDPPYVHETRNVNSRKIYNFEMTDDDHRRLAETLHLIKGKAVISGYSSALYMENYSSWRLKEFDIANHAAGGQTKARQTECVWMNF